MESQTMTITKSAKVVKTLQPKIKSHFYLAKPKESIFINIKTKEYPTMNLIYGFLHKQMGVKLRKHITALYADEQTHYTNYIKKYNIDEDCIETRYSHTAHGWGRINPSQSLSLSLFHRPSRHSFAKDNYLDFDMVSAQPQMFYELATLEGIPTDGLAEYCANPKVVRQTIVDYYHLVDIKSDDGVVLTAMEQAKKLPIRLAFGGGIRIWKQQFVNVRIDDMDIVKKMETTLKKIRSIIVKENPHLKADLDENGGDDYQNKTDEEKDRSVMALFIQTWERIIQEHAIAYMVRVYNLTLGDIIPSQDGFMPLKKIITDKNIDIAELFLNINKSVKDTFKMDIKWAMKSFDEAIVIEPSDIVPIKMTEEDLLKGETHIAKMIAPCLKNKLFYSNKTELWYYTDKRNVWIKSKKPNEYFIVTTIQYYIKELADDLWNQIGKEKDLMKKEKLTTSKKAVDKHFKLVGQSSFQTQITKYLRTLLQDDFFPLKLDNTGGKVVFYDGIFDLKTGIFRRGIEKTDFITITLSRCYKVDYDTTKMSFLKSVLKKILNNNDEHLEYHLSVMGYSFTGDAHLEKSIYYVMDGTENKDGDNGKTFLFGVLEHFFPEYVRQTDPTLLEANNTKLHKQLVGFEGVRILYADEGTKKKLNHKLMKKLGDGEYIETDVMYGNCIKMRVSYKLFVCSNHLPVIEKEEQAVYNRYKQIEFCSHFDRTGSREVEVPEKLQFIADMTLRDKMRNEYENEIIALMLEYAMKYYKKGLPPIPSQFIDATNKTKIENNDFAKWFYDEYESSADSRVSIRELEQNCPIMGYKRADIIKELGRISIIWNKELKGLGSYLVDGKEIQIRGGLVGYKKKVINNEDQ
jgi:phage/plasmid-associated DNA primase